MEGLFWQRGVAVDFAAGDDESFAPGKQAAIVVTADHGVSYREGFSNRHPITRRQEFFPDLNTALDILKSPVMMKMPSILWSPGLMIWRIFVTGNE